MSNTIVLKQGLSLPIKGEAQARLAATIRPATVSVRPTEFPGFTPRLLVKEGDKVLCGSPVLADKKDPRILVASPVSGTVKAVVRGEKRKLLSVDIQPAEQQECLDLGVKQPGSLDAAQIKAAILESGLWPFIIQRPYGIIANPEDTPKAIFVSAFNTAPLAPNAEYVLGESLPQIQAGIDALNKLTGGGVHVGLNEDNYSGTPFHKLENAALHVFKGKHPAGNVGVQISHVCPVTKGSVIWTVSLLGLAAIGERMLTGKYCPERKVAVTGPAAKNPAYVLTIPGACMASFAEFGTTEQGVRVVSGDVLSGTNVGAEGSLGFYDNQVTLLREGTKPELLGWLNPIRSKVFSTDRNYPASMLSRKKYDMDTNLHGGPRAFVMSDAYYSKVLPMDIFPLYLVKACLAGDIEKMEKFGIYEVIPEDLALCEFVDPSKNNIQDIVAKGIALMLKEMA